MKSIYFKGQIIEGCEKPMPIYEEFKVSYGEHMVKINRWQAYLESLPSNQKFLWKGKEGAFKDGQSVVEGVDYVKGSRSEFYAGAYMNTCCVCNKQYTGSDKLWFMCQSCCAEIIALPLQQPEREQGDGTIIQFLLGSHSYEGVWFGDKHPTRKGNFWWREILREASQPVIGDSGKERIICAANYYQDGKVHEHQPNNISNGFITCGRRHHNCIGSFAMIVGFPYTDEGQRIHNTEVQGFLTNTNRFVDRKEAFQIARMANQITGPNKGQVENSIGLTSEDLY